MPSQMSTPSNAPSPLMGSEYLFLSEPQSPEHAPSSPPEHASTRGLPPSRPDSPASPDYNDFYRAFGDLSPLTPPASVLATTAQRQRVLTSPPQPPPAAQPMLLALAPQPAPAVPAQQSTFPLANPVPPLQPRHMVEAVLLFHGDQATVENASDFIKAYNRSMMFLNPLATDRQKMLALPNYFGTGSPAEKWYDDLMANPPGTWEDLVTAFNERWPTVKSAMQTSEEYQTELLELKMAEEDIGVIKTIGRQRVWTHVKWAEEALELANLAGIRTGLMLIWQVKKNLPQVIRKQLNNKYADWTAFTTAVKDVNTTRLKQEREDIEERKRQEEERERKILHKVEAVKKATTADLSAQLQCLTIGQVAVSQMTVGPVPRSGNKATTRFAIQAGPRRTTPYVPPTEGQKETVQKGLEMYPHQRLDNDGQKTYVNQLADWATKHGAFMRIAEDTLYPLKLGTAMICSRECFHCGTHSHGSFKCPTEDHDESRLSRSETAWRALCNRILGPFNKNNAQNIRRIALEGQENNAGSL